MQSSLQVPFSRSACIFCNLRIAATWTKTLIRTSSIGEQRRKITSESYRDRGYGRNGETLRIRNRKDDWEDDSGRRSRESWSKLSSKADKSSPTYDSFRAARNVKPSDERNIRRPLAREKTVQLKDQQIRSLLVELRKNILQDKIVARLQLPDKELSRKFNTFIEDLLAQIAARGKAGALLERWRKEIFNARKFELDAKMDFMGQVIMQGFTKQDRQQQERVANLQYPQEWFPATRTQYRELHLHVGPTNSGKTYHALKRLEDAKNGLYAGPLRLLAHEVYMRLNARGIRCNLVTGDERRTADDDPIAPMTSCTVEMVPLNTPLDVAVIDEIQMIGSDDRGWAWTQAVLGVRAKELHMCGEERAVPIIKEIAALCGDKLHIHRYERLNPLKMMSRSLEGDVKNLRKGDCVVCFSVMAIHSLRQLIEKTLKCKVAVIYGSLPPETRAQQAKLFNDPESDYDILVASDAVGMGLNLSIKRMIFQTGVKHNGQDWGQLQVHEAKQIAGRAGRFSTADQDIKTAKPGSSNTSTEANSPPVVEVSSPTPPVKAVGLVTTLEQFDHPIISKLLTSEPIPITSAGILAPSYIIEQFVRYFPRGTPFSLLLNRLHDIASTNSRFHICALKSQVNIANAIEDVDGLTVTDRMIFCSSPSDPRRPGEVELINTFAKLVGERKAVSVLDVPELELDLLNDDWSATRGYLHEIEALHKAVVLWSWLSYRYPSIFIEQELAFHVKGLVEKRIEETLEKMSFDFQRIRRAREQAIKDMLRQQTSNEGFSNEEDAGQVAEDIVRNVASG